MANDRTDGTFSADAQRVSGESGVPLPSPPYRFGIDRCWSCGHEFLAYAWPHGGPWGTSEPPEGRPDTVKKVHSETVGYPYWSSTCPFCGERTGDFFLFYRKSGPFFVLLRKSLKETPESYGEDMEAVAAWHGNPERVAAQAAEAAERTRRSEHGKGE